MLDPELQQRFARQCADAAFGYSAAGTAACAAFADQVLNFWKAVLQPGEAPARSVQSSPFPWPMPPWPMPMPMAPQPLVPSPVAQTPFSWMLPQPAPRAPKAPPLPSNPWEALAQFADAMSGALAAMSAMPVKTAAGPSNPMAAWLTSFPFAAPPTAAWPMAFLMMSSGVPHAVAWPTAEANAAVLDAAETARRSISEAFASYRTEGGHTAGASMWPPMEALTLMAAVPLNIGTMLTAMRLH